MRLPSRAVDLFAALLSPPRCAACDAAVPFLRAFCAACAATCLPPDDGPVRATGAYGGAMATAISRLKFGGRPDVAVPLGDLLDAAAGALDVDAIVPVPLGRERLRERGYNQAALLGARVGRARGLPQETSWLRRARESAPQATLGRAARARNVAGAFAASPACRGARVVLVDDVVTTGATLRAAEEALEEAGARVIGGLAVAVALLDGDAPEVPLAATRAPSEPARRDARALLAHDR
ncbi:MAG: ComF family protein [Polyangiaceae bacterium]|nr:ComF family protein [Polyangiaceae bacterium]